MTPSGRNQRPSSRARYMDLDMYRVELRALSVGLSAASREGCAHDPKVCIGTDDAREVWVGRECGEW